MAGYKICGTVAPGYEPVKALLEDYFKQGWEEHSQVRMFNLVNKLHIDKVCAYVDGKVVVDLWGVSETAPRKDDYGPDSITIIMSSAKSIAALVTALMVDRGLLDYHELIWKYWPEFGKEGKALVRLKDVMRHEAGMPKLSKQFAPKDLMTENIKNNAIGKLIESQRLTFPTDHGTIRAYHTSTRGKTL